MFEEYRSLNSIYRILLLTKRKKEKQSEQNVSLKETGTQEFIKLFLFFSVCLKQSILKCKIVLWGSHETATCELELKRIRSPAYEQGTERAFSMEETRVQAHRYAQVKYI